MAISKITCVNCGKRFLDKYNVCGYCGQPKQAKSKSFISYKEILDKHYVPKSCSEIQPDILIKKVKILLEKESSIRMQIVCMNKKLLDLITIKSNNTGFVKITANGKEIQISEASFRITIQDDVNNLMSELNNSMCALEEFINKFK